MQIAAFAAAGDEPGRDELTRPFVPSALVEAPPGVAISRVSASDGDLTAPLVRASAPQQRYASDTELTRPLLPSVDAAAFVPRPAPVPTFPGMPAPTGRSLVLPPPPVPERAPAPVSVSVPRPSAGVVEHSPSIQITPMAGAVESTPSSRPASSRGFPQPTRHQTLPRIPRAAAIPAEFEHRVSGSSVVPVVAGSFTPSAAATGGANRWMLALAAVVFGAAVVGVAMRPRNGAVVVTVSGPTGGAVRGVSIRVDGTERCNTTPCEVNDLVPGAHFISAAAVGLSASANRAFVIGSGEHAAQHVALSDAERAAAQLNVSAIGDGLHVFVDGRDVGVPPVSLSAVEPGRHTIRVVGADRYYQPYEESVKLDRGEVRSLGPVRLHVVRGRLELRAGDGSDAARVWVDGRRISNLPTILDLSADQAHEVTATRPGFTEFSEQVVFDGVAERSVDVQLERAGATAAARAVPRAASNVRPRVASAPRPRVVAAPASSPAPATTGMATLDLNSIPRAAVVVNGRPIGTTPLRGIRVEPGNQTITFIHPELGRKVTSASVGPGGRAAVGVKF